jgi:hypothetical protein
MALDLPDGILYNYVEEDLLEIEIPFEVVEEWACSSCKLRYISKLLGSNGRYEGHIYTAESEYAVWQNPLPKKKEKALEYLSKSLGQKIQRHLEAHK